MSISQFESDEELMRCVAQGDEAAIAELYDRFGRLVYRLAHQMTPSRADAEDAVQDIFVRLWRTAGKYDVQRAALSTWIVLLSRRYLVDRLRRAKTRVKSKVMFEEKWMSSKGESAPTDEIAAEEHYQSLMDQIEQLPDLQQRVVKRAYLGGQTLRQIGIELDRPLGTIKSTLSRALVRLREKVGEESMT